ncbi:hypothetical protein [Neisseria chenwenguii]|uniref:hypothetical protein n=1 Tax=Neisseria chenwenguii TaxID=1853278 RepID=UPI000F4E2CF3|nr:hypothetical protein [Neisseria chenwenguii]
MKQEVQTKVVAANGNRTFYEATRNPIENQKGWQLALPKGFISIDDAYVRRNKVAQFFAFSNKASENSANVCTSSGQSALIEVSLFTGGLYSDKLFDTNNDKRFSEGDVQASAMITSEGLSLKRVNVKMQDAQSGKLGNKVLCGSATAAILRKSTSTR